MFDKCFMFYECFTMLTESCNDCHRRLHYLQIQLPHRLTANHQQGLPIMLQPACRFGKSTHISMISNSVTHLWSYTNSAIAGNSPPISPVTPRDHRRCRAERRRLRIQQRRLHIERRYRRIECGLFHDVSQCFKCFMVFY